MQLLGWDIVYTDCIFSAWLMVKVMWLVRPYVEISWIVHL